MGCFLSYMGHLYEWLFRRIHAVAETREDLPVIIVELQLVSKFIQECWLNNLYSDKNVNELIVTFEWTGNLVDTLIKLPVGAKIVLQRKTILELELPLWGTVNAEPRL